MATKKAAIEDRFIQYAPASWPLPFVRDIVTETDDMIKSVPFCSVVASIAITMDDGGEDGVDDAAGGQSSSAVTSVIEIEATMLDDDSSEMHDAMIPLDLVTIDKTELLTTTTNCGPAVDELEPEKSQPVLLLPRDGDAIVRK